MKTACIFPAFATLTKKEWAMISHIPEPVSSHFLEDSTMKGNHLTLTMRKLDSQ